MNRNVIITLVLTFGFIWLYILKGGYFVLSDASLQLLAFQYETKRMFSSGLPLWSWDTYFGQDFMFAYSFYTSLNPFAWLNCLFPYKYLPIGFVLVLYLKFLLCGYFCDIYLRHMGFNKSLCLIGSLLYTFSSWTVCVLFYCMFIEPMMLFPMLLLSIEWLLIRKKYAGAILSIVVFVTLWINYYFAPGTFIAAAIYFIFRLSAYRHKLKLILMGVRSVTVGILMSAIVIIPTCYVLINSQSTGITFHTDIWNYPERILSLIFPKIQEGDTPFILVSSYYSTNAAHILVFGYLAAVLLFFKRRFWLSWLFVSYLILYLTPLNAIFCLFTNATYSRWLYALIMIGVLSLLYWLKNYGILPMKYIYLYILLTMGAFLAIGGASVYWHVKHGILNSDWICLLLAVFILLTINLVSLYILFKNGYDRKKFVSMSVFSISLCAILQIQCFTLWDSRNGTLSNKVDFDLPKIFESYGDLGVRPFEYRTDFMSSDFQYNLLNYSAITGVPSVQSFHSIKSGKIEYLCGTCDTTYRRSTFDPFYNRTSFDALMSVKEVAIFEPSSQYDYAEFDQLRFNRQDGAYTVYDFAYYIPMGYSYDKYQLADSVIPKSWITNERDVPLSLLDAIAIKKDDEAEIAKYLTKTSFNGKLDIDSLVEKRREVTCYSFIGDNRGFEAHIELESPRVIFFSVIYLPQMKATIDGISTKIYETNLGLSAIIVPKGKHEVWFDYKPDGLVAGAMISLLGILLLILMAIAEKRQSIYAQKKGF